MLMTLANSERLRVAVGRLARRLRQQSKGLTPSQSSLLFTLDRKGPLSMSDLADIESISRPSATGIVSRLIEKGYVEKRENPDDGRSSIVSIANRGSELLDQRRKETTAFLAHAVEQLSEEEQLILVRATELLERITKSS